MPMGTLARPSSPMGEEGYSLPMVLTWDSTMLPGASMPMVVTIVRTTLAPASMRAYAYAPP